eukprot:5161732-Prymnesium_polylepis.1
MPIISLRLIVAALAAHAAAYHVPSHRPAARLLGQSRRAAPTPRFPQPVAAADVPRAPAAWLVRPMVRAVGAVRGARRAWLQRPARVVGWA